MDSTQLLLQPCSFNPVLDSTHLDWIVAATTTSVADSTATATSTTADYPMDSYFDYSRLSYGQLIRLQQIMDGPNEQLVLFRGKFVYVICDICYHS